MTAQQMDDRRYMEEQHREMFRNFHQEWNEKISVFEGNQLDQEVVLLERQNEELLLFYQQMKDYVPSNLPRVSKKLLESRTRQAQLAGQKEYNAAYEQMLQADEIEMNDLRRLEVEKAEQFRRKENLLKRKHLQEQRALGVRVESKRLQLEKLRKQELDKLLQMYVNYSRTMENQQNIVRGRTGQLIYNHTKNTKSDKTATTTMAESARSGTYGPLVAKRHQKNAQNNTPPPQ
ncbi:hypothetical protein AGDE_02560 [Angomonas deanei]|uniref:Uncharacterized protein n=1 Tax=Angomonas deanei TaxID=59799 RepID=S9WLH8_9TRYP|nr:hypothetical protein AGDE_03942 [Angomonas deanei]EPY41364.1 hypothetical protein AGDE_02560 [Angomonas deanei]CAD2212979.1 hypothetical protein, conserved [Angomonas deanei]|eukprot:EPY39986.1 hypothetical protein AGDE_03942 [Angomonas deanei]